MIRLAEISRKHKLSGAQVMKRAEMLGVKTIVENRARYFFEADVAKIVQAGKKNTYKRYTEVEMIQIKFKVVDLYLALENNSITNISKITSVSFSIVSKIVNDFLTHKYIEVPSKLNFEK